MPITPFHFGPGALVHAVAPSRISFLSFCTANVLIDVEPLYFMLTHQYPLHRFFHTYIGATLGAIATVGLFVAVQRAAPALRLPNIFGWRYLTISATTLGAFLGAYSHVALDSLMHRDITPLAPFSNNNSLLGAVSLSTLHWSCLAAAATALVLLGVRKAIASRRTP